MAKYPVDYSVLELDEFKSFLKEQIGSDDVNTLYDYERDAWIWLFKYANNDIDENDKKMLSDMENQISEDTRQKVLDKYFQGKSFDELKDNEKAFALAYGVKTDQHLAQQKLQNKDDISSQKTDDKQELQGVTKENRTNVETRDRSRNSDQNEYLLDDLQLAVLKDMGKIDDDTLSKTASPGGAIEVLHDFRANNELTTEEWKDFENRLTEKMIDENVLQFVPPKLLGQKYEELRQIIATAPEGSDVSREQQMFEKVENRIDVLCSNLEKKEGLYFADVTNISDAYDGYMAMFEAREQGLSDTPEDNQKKEVIENGKNYLNDVIAEYDNEWNLNGENLDKNAEQRFDQLNKLLPSVNVSDETLQLISNFKFNDLDRQPEPQFQSADGTLSDTYSPGATVIPGSKLDNIILVAKQNVLMHELGSDTPITTEDLTNNLNEEVQATLFSLHVSDRVARGGIENPDEFTNKEHLQAFVRKLADIEHPMSITPAGYEAGIDNCINATGAYAHRLSKKLNKNSSIPVRLFDPLQKLDKRAKDRTVEEKPSLRALRLKELKGMGKLGLSAFLVSGAITTAGTIAASDASLTAATGGLNKLAGAALGVTLGVTMTARTIWKWRKQRKKDGLPCGLKAMVKDPRLMTTVTTTALGAAALGFAATGNPGIAAACGYGSLVIGGGSSAVLSYRDNVKAGMGKAEAAAWAIGRAAVTGVAAWAGRETANTLIDAYNQYNPDNKIFQHEEKTGSHDETITTTEKVLDFDALDQNAKEFLQNNWYKDNPDLLNSRIDALQNAGVEHPHHMLLTAHDAGMQAPDNMAMYDGGTSNGYHTVFGEGFAQQHNVSYDSIQDMKMLFNNDGTVNADAISAYDGLKSHVGMNNFVSTIENRPVNEVLYPERHSTYDHDQMHFPTKEITHTETISHDDYAMVRNETDLGLGMVGVLTHPLKAAKRLKERVGAFMDRVLNRKKEPGKNLKNPGDNPGNPGWYSPGEPPRESANPKEGIKPVNPPKKGKEPGNPGRGRPAEPPKGPGNQRQHPDPDDPSTWRLDLLQGDNVFYDKHQGEPYNEVTGLDADKANKNIPDIVESVRGKLKDKEAADNSQQQVPNPNDPSTWRLDRLQGDNVFYDKTQGNMYNEVKGLDTTIQDKIDSVRKKKEHMPNPNDPSTWRLDGLQGDNVFYDKSQGVAYNEVMGLDGNTKEKPAADNKQTASPNPNAENLSFPDKSNER